MLGRRSVPFTVLLFLLIRVAAFAIAESAENRGQVSPHQIQVRVTLDNHGPVGEQLRVDLLNQALVPTRLTFTDSAGRAWFCVEQPGEYRVRLSGHNLQETTSDEILVDQAHPTKIALIQVKPRITVIYHSKPKNAATASATDLAAPEEAHKYFHDGLQAFQRGNFHKACSLFERAVHAYPRYDTAYNNLGVVYVQLGQANQAWQAFQQAVQINDKNADASRNLSRLLIQTGAYARAVVLLRKSLVVEPLNPGGLTLAAGAEVATAEYDAALQDARKVHELPHEGFAASHYYAGQALEHKQQLDEARAEYELYLLEDPNGPEANDVRVALSRVSGGPSNIARKEGQ